MLKWVGAFTFAIIGLSSKSAFAGERQIDEVVNFVCAAEGAYKNLASVAVMRERAGNDFEAIAPYCLAYNEGWKAGWEARETQSVATNYNEQCREQLIREMRGDTGALERFAGSISNDFAKLAFLEHCQTYKDGLTDGLRLAKEIIK